jgi:polyisoprenoid-binding protein YceI
MRLPAVLTASVCMLCSYTVLAEPVTYRIDPRHTYPAFEADHQGGLSIWRGKIKRNEGQIVIDRAAKTGRVDVTMHMDSIDFGLEAMNTSAKDAEIFDVAKFPQAKYSGQLTNFTHDGKPTAIDGSLTLRGVTRPLRLQITNFQCQPNPRNGREVCGADARATFQRDEFGVDYGKNTGFFMGVTLLISVEAVREETAAAPR